MLLLNSQLVIKIKLYNGKIC
jgi:hypothetical protein